MFYFPAEASLSEEKQKSKDWSGYSLIVAAVSVGNVGQLTTDLVVSTLEMTKVGYIYDESLLPVVGNHPYSAVNSSSCSLMTGCEVYECEEKKLVVLLQRAPFAKGKQSGYRKRLVQWIKEQMFGQVIILTSSSAHERLDVQLHGSQFRFLLSPGQESTVGDFLQNKLKWKPLEKRPCFPAPSAIESESNRDQNMVSLYIPGGGIAKTLFTDCCDAEIPVSVLLLFCAEGDNAWHAKYLATILNQWMNLVPMPMSPNLLMPSDIWKIPPSWRLTFGNTFDQTLFH
ncbi:proteasome assembly chaperone 2 [Octopus sinensis]|uniref:Proteasome assembly chaperone 2 n=1 Tax=Octopus sinensis TaxID=2607531 RepID=A0A6P7SIJ9_9MOLL|nr:proteasome assembly chaperone 2 [Octopus sinensis]